MVKNLPHNRGDAKEMGLILGLGRFLGVGNGSHPSNLAWKIPWTEEPGGLQSMGLKDSDITKHAHQTYPNSQDHNFIELAFETHNTFHSFALTEVALWT